MELLLGIAAFLLADNHHRLAIEECHARDDGRIVGEGAVAMQFHEVREQTLDVVQAVRTLWMPGKLHPFPGWIDGGLRGGRCGWIFHSFDQVARTSIALGAADALDFGAKFLVRPYPSGHIQNNREVLRPFEPQPDSRFAGLALE